MRYYIGFLVTAGLLVVLIFLLFHGGGKTNGPTTSMPLSSYASTGSEVRLTIDGPINADQDHVQLQITANQNTVTYDQLQGYDGTVVNQQQFANSENAYAAFLHALQVAGFTEVNTSQPAADEQGQCALGYRYIFELIQNGSDQQRTWATSCPSAPRTYNGALSLSLTLFEVQVPGYVNLIRHIVF